MCATRAAAACIWRCTNGQPIDNGAPRNENESQNDKERGDRGGGTVIETDDVRSLAKALKSRLSVISTRG